MPGEAASLLERAQAAGLLPKEKPSNDTGYAGVTEVKGRFEARVCLRVGSRGTEAAAGARWAASAQPVMQASRWRKPSWMQPAQLHEARSFLLQRNSASRAALHHIQRACQLPLLRRLQQ